MSSANRDRPYRMNRRLINQFSRLNSLAKPPFPLKWDVESKSMIPREIPPATTCAIHLGGAFNQIGWFLIGFGWIFASPKQWVFVLTTVAVIFAAQLRALGSLANYSIFTILVQAAYFVIIGAYAVAKTRVEPLLDGVFGWIRDHLRATAVGLFAFFGVVFLVKGLSALS